MAVPPNKKRKTSNLESMWEDDGDEDFTEDQLAKVDDIIMASQQVARESHESHTFANEMAVHTPQDENRHPSRLMGRGTPKSRSAGEVSAPRPNNPSRMRLASSSRSRGNSVKPGPRPLAFTSNQPVVGAHEESSSSTVSTMTKAAAQHSSASPASQGAKSDEIHTKVKFLQDQKDLKEGEIKILRDKLATNELEVQRVKQENSRLVEQKQVERTERENNLMKECERLKGQLHFKENEITQLQNQYQRLGVSSNNVSSPRHGSPAKAKRAGQAEPSITPTSGFPTVGVFNSKTPERNSGQSATSSVTSSLTMSATCTVSLARLKSSQHEGKVTGSQLVSKLLKAGATVNKSPTSFSLHWSRHVSNTPSVSSHSNPSTRNSSSSTKSTQNIDTRSWGWVPSAMFETLELLLKNKTASFSTDTTDGVSLMASETEDAVRLLRPIESYLQSLFAVSKPAPGSDGSFSSSKSSTTPSPKSASLDSCSLDSGTDSPGSYGNINNQILKYLHMLLVLVENSFHVRKVLLLGEINMSVLCDGRQANQSKPTPGPSTAQGKGDNQGKSMDELNESVIQQLSRNCSIMRNLYKLANMVHSKRVLPVVVIEAMNIIGSVFRSASVGNLERLDTSPLYEALLNAFPCESVTPSESQINIAIAASDLLCTLCVSKKLRSSLCPCNGDCVFTILYAFYGLETILRSPNINSVFLEKLINMLSITASTYKDGLAVLVESNCDCSTDVVKTLIRMLYRHFQHLNSTAPRGERPCDPQLLLLQEGVLMLHMFWQRDRLFTRHQEGVQHQYVSLISGVEVLRQEQILKIGSSVVQDMYECYPFAMDTSDEDPDQAQASTSRASRLGSQKEDPMEIVTID